MTAFEIISTIIGVVTMLITLCNSVILFLTFLDTRDKK